MEEPREPLHHLNVGEYFALVEEGRIGPDDRVELLEGIILSMHPQTPRHAAGVMCLERVLREELPASAILRVQMPFLASEISVPEPDVAVVDGNESDYVDRHPSAALLLVEVAETSAVQDRLTKAPIYAAAGIRDYWLVNLRDECVEVFSDPVPEERRYRRSEKLSGGGILTLDAFPDVRIAAAELILKRSA
jgi:Uma2 family endonuclease